MKKLLSLLAAVGLVATASAPAVSCSIGSYVDESIDPVLEQQNFNILNELAKSENKGKSIQEVLKIKPQDFYFSNGLPGDNKFIDNRLDSIDGSFNSGKWSFIDLINSKFNLGLKRNVKVNEDAIKSIDKNSISNLTYGDLESNKYFNFDSNDSIDNFSSLNDIKIGSVDGSYQENGEAPVATPASQALTLDTFNKFVNLGNTKFWNNEQGKTPNEAAWQKQMDFFKYDFDDADKNEFKDRTYTRNVHVKDDKTNKEFVFTQLIKLKNTNVVNGDNSKGSTSYVETIAKKWQDDYKKLVGKNTWSNFTEDDFMNLMFSKINVFTAAKQEYSVSVYLDCNDLRKQFEDADKNYISIVNEYFNSKNEETIGQFFINKMDTYAKKHIQPNNSILKADDSGDGNDTNSQIDLSTVSLGDFKPRIGENIDSLKKLLVKKVLAAIALMPNYKGIKVSEDDLEVVVNDSDNKPIVKTDSALVAGDYVIVQAKSTTPVNPSPDDPNKKAFDDTPTTSSPIKAGTKITIDKDNFDGENLSKMMKDAAVTQFELDALQSSELINNDFLYKTFGIKDKDSLDAFFDKYWIDLDSQNTTYVKNSPVYKIRDQKFSNTAGIDDVLNLAKQMADNMNNTSFTSALNVKDNKEVKFSIHLSDADFNGYSATNNGAITFSIQNQDFKFNQ